MRLTVNMPWERDLSVNTMRFGKPSPKARGKWKKLRVRKPHVQAWMERLSGEIRWLHPLDLGRFGCWTIGVNGSILPSEKYYIYRPENVKILIDFRFPDKRRRDTHNYFKVIADAVAAGLGIDDKDILISARSAAVDRENPGFTIEVRDELDAT